MYFNVSVKKMLILWLGGLFIAQVVGEYVVTEMLFKFYEHSGLEVSIPADPKISAFSLRRDDGIDILAIKPTGGLFVLILANEKFNIGDKIELTLQVNYDGNVYELKKHEIVDRECLMRVDIRRFLNKLISILF